MEDSDDDEERQEEEESDQVLSFTRNLAGLVRQNFQGIPISAQGQSNESAVPALSTQGATQTGRFTISMWCYWIPVMIQFPGVLSGKIFLTLAGLSRYLWVVEHKKQEH